MGDDGVPEGKLFATFERHGEFVGLQKSFLSLDLFEEPSVEDDKEQNPIFARLLLIVRPFIISLYTITQRNIA